MKAIVKTKAEPGIELLDLEVPVVGENDILIRVLVGSLCGSDVHVFEWTAGYEWMPMPIILGHEFCGEVVEIGKNIRGVSEGDRVTAMPMFPCGECEFCLMGKIDRCRKRPALGLTTDGAFSEYLTIKGGADIFRIPDNVSSETASLCEPLSICMNAVDTSGIRPGETAAVFGPGPIGLLMTQLLRAAGAGTIIVTGTSADKRRLAIAEQMGADAIINVDEEDPLKRVREIAGRLDVVFEATGVPHTIGQGLKMVKNGGKVIVVGIHAGEATFDPIDLVRRHKSLVGVYAFDKDIWKRSLALMSSGRIDIAPIITHRLPLSQGAEGFELAANRTAAKVVFVAEG